MASEAAGDYATQDQPDDSRLRPIRPDVIPALDTELPTFLRRSVTAR